MSVLLHEPGPSPRECIHDRSVLLGSEGAATFYGCDVCGSVIIIQTGHRWILPRSPPP